MNQARWSTGERGRRGLAALLLLLSGCGSPEATPPRRPDPAPAPVPAVRAEYVGSAQCQSCHRDVYERWRKTRMANVVRDPREHPEAILPDLAVPNPLVTFTKDQIAFVYGSRWKQRYFARSGEDYVPLPAQWDVVHQQWRPYHVAKGTDWWTAVYPDDNAQRPTGPLCDGCHSVNYDLRTRTVTEWNVGCERCHGPGSEHVRRPVASTIQSPQRMDARRANDVCIQCHSQGRPLADPSPERPSDWPVGYHVGLPLENFWKLEEHTLGETTFTHFADGTAHKNRMQGNDFVTSQMYLKQVTCYDCHDVHGTRWSADIRRPGNKLCLGCHSPKSATGPRAATLEEHTHHRADSPGSECAACHMPKIETTISDVMVRSHTFRFIPPTLTDSSKIPNSCNACHTDKTTQWAQAALKGWPEFSPWRTSR